MSNGNGKLNFQPTKTWLKEHKSKPPECLEDRCVCILDNFTHNHQGFCVGYFPCSDDLDMISLCWSGWDLTKSEPYLARAVMHPAEASLMATFLGLAVTHTWGLIPEYRDQLGRMLRKRTIATRKYIKGDTSGV